MDRQSPVLLKAVDNIPGALQIGKAGLRVAELRVAVMPRVLRKIRGIMMPCHKINRKLSVPAEFHKGTYPELVPHTADRRPAHAEPGIQLGDVNESYSYWTFGDIFEEKGVPFTPFHGGFGLVANGNIPKPTFWTFKFFRDLSGTCVHRSDELVVLKKEDGSYCGVAWNQSRTRTGRELAKQANRKLKPCAKLFSA